MWGGTWGPICGPSWGSISEIAGPDTRPFPDVDTVVGHQRWFVCDSFLPATRGWDP